MATMTFSPTFPPLSHDFAAGPSLLDSPSSPTIDLESLEEFERSMTQIHQYGDGDNGNQMQWTAQSPSASSRSGALSPDKLEEGHQNRAASMASEGSYALSPADASMILTPTSTNHDDFHDDPESDFLSTSPGSRLESPVDTFVHVDRFDSHPSAVNRRMNVSRPAPVPGVYSSATPASRPLRETSLLRQTPAPQWAMQSFGSSSDTSMDDHYNPYHASSIDLDFTGASFNAGDFASAQMFPDHFSGQTYGNLPFRALNDGSMSTPQAYGTQAMMPQATTAFGQTMPGPSGPYQQGSTQSPFSYNQVTPVSQYQGGLGQNYPSFNQPMNATQQQHRTVSSQRAGQRQQHTLNTLQTNSQMQIPPSSQMYRQSIPQVQHAHSPTVDRKHIPSSSRSPTMPSGTQRHQPTHSAQIIRQQRPIKVEPSQAVARRPHPSQSDGIRKGGRSKNSHLNEASRQKSHSMRKVGACWRCAMQRDPCDEGSPCNRCTMRSQRGQTYYFDCDRSKLPDFVQDFLPPSMTLWHQKHFIEESVASEVLSWDHDNGMDIYLSCGYGPPLRWKVYEFMPRTQDLLGQMQYLMDDSGATVSQFKYSPPLGLVKIDSGDDGHLEAYLDQLMEPHILQSFGWKCYEEEQRFNEGFFQVKLLELMCNLYINTADTTLRLLLRDILRMILINYIMVHTLSISEDTLYTVLASIRHSRRPPNTARYTSPRLASRQLKFYLGILRNNIYEKILKWQQATLHSAGKKEATWLQTFCVMLGFAMVLEEVQRTMQLQADTAEKRGEMLPDEAILQAKNACERIDARYKLLIGLFQCKYRDRKWGANGSFGPGTPKVQEPAQREFLSSLRGLVEERCDHLNLRAQVEFREDQFHLYTTRLTARFLLPFLNLPIT